LKIFEQDKQVSLKNTLLEKKDNNYWFSKMAGLPLNDQPDNVFEWTQPGQWENFYGLSRFQRLYA
jgi:hypothetical protein